MLSRRSAKCIAHAYAKKFTRGSPGHTFVHKQTLYEFLFEHEFAPWLYNMFTRHDSPTRLKNLIMELHTGETIPRPSVAVTQDSIKTGRHCLIQLASALWKHYRDEVNPYRPPNYELEIRAVRNSLELDGYIYRNGTFLRPEGEVLDMQEETGVLHVLFTSLALGREEEFRGFLELSEEHFISSKWGDCIINSRKLLEIVFQESAEMWSDGGHGKPLSANKRDSANGVREYLAGEGLLEKREKEAIAKVYGLLSHTGAHPYSATKDQARLLRQLALTLCQFMLLRLEGKLKGQMLV